MAGYSGTPLAAKLGIKAGQRLFLSNPPDNYGALVAPLPEGVAIVTRPGATTDCAHLFVTARKDLERRLRSALKTLRDDCPIWISWPKKASGVATDITEDTIREVALPLGLVDVKVCAVDQTWSGLKLVVRVERRAVKR